MNKVHILIISDIHLGLEFCNAKVLLEILEGYSYQKLIIVGDLYERGGIINDEQFKVIKYLRENREKIIYIDGNHDPSDGLPNILGIDMVKKYEWSLGTKRFCAMHGHQFDKWCFIFNEPLVDKIFSSILRFFKMINVQEFNVAKWFDSLHEKFSLHIANKAIKYAKRHKINIIICGHTHRLSHVEFFDRNGCAIDYFNCGGWVEDLCSFITIDENCAIKLHSIDPNLK